MSTADDKRDANLDAMLADWPAPERDEGAWEDAESKLHDRIGALSIGEGDEAWFAPPLPAEPDEEGYAQPQPAAGDRTMSGPDPEKPKKKSLKEFAQRVSVAPPLPAGADAAPPSGGPTSKSTVTPLPQDSGSRGSLASRPSFVSRPPEARDSDSGLVDLNAVRNSAASIPDNGAMPGTSGLFDEDPAVAAAAPKASAQPTKSKGSSIVPILGGGFVAIAAIAAAALLFVRSGGDYAADSLAEAPAAAQRPAEPAATSIGPSPAAAAEATPESLAIASAESASADAPGRADNERDDGKSETSSDRDEAGDKRAAKKDDDKPAAKKDDGKDPDDLAGAMAGAVGATNDDGSDKKDDAKGPAVDPSSIPESPSQGAIQGALGSVMGAAKSCVAGMDAPSRASITFGSSGSVSRVSVSGPAAGKAAGSCIQAALRGARVGPFKRSSFTVGVTIRP